MSSKGMIGKRSVSFGPSVQRIYNMASPEYKVVDIHITELSPYLLRDIDLLIETLESGKNQCLFFKDYRVEPKHLPSVKSLRGLIAFIDLENRFDQLLKLAHPY